jgi:hypothetical protein
MSTRPRDSLWAVFTASPTEPGSEMRRQNLSLLTNLLRKLSGSGLSVGELQKDQLSSLEAWLFSLAVDHLSSFIDAQSLPALRNEPDSESDGVQS